MSARIPKLAFAPPSVTAEAACAPEIQAISPISESSSFQRLLSKFRSDEQLAEELRNGNGDALTELFKRHGGLLFHIAQRILCRQEEAEDVVQQVFLDIFRSIDQYDAEKGSFKTWLLMSAYHRALNHRRSLITGRFFQTDQLDESLPTPMVRSTGKYSSPEAHILLEQTLASLPPRQRRTIELVYFGGLTAEEVSRRTGETVRVVRHNLYRGLDRLRRMLCDESDKPGSALKDEPR